MFKNIVDQDAFADKVRTAQSEFSNYKYPESREEYWGVVDKYWVPLLDIILRFGPEYVEHDGDLKKLAIVATILKETRSTELEGFFQKSWCAAPDDGGIHAIPAWHILCDLCSESYLLFKESSPQS